MQPQGPVALAASVCSKLHALDVNDGEWLLSSISILKADPAMLARP
jgi:hypothetical protein